MNSSNKRLLIMGSAGCLLGLLAALTPGQATGIAPAATATATTKTATTKPPAAPKVAAPASIADLLAAGPKLFDAANTGDWTAAAKESAALKEVMKKVHADLPKPDAAQQTRLKAIATHITAIDAAIKAKTRQPAILDANRLIRASGILADTFINKVPQSVWQMEYLAREMQVSSADPADLTKLKALPGRLDAEWAKIGKDATAKGGADLVKELTDEMAKAKAAATADDFAKLTKPLLETLGKVEKAYLK